MGEADVLSIHEITNYLVHPRRVAAATEVVVGEGGRTVDAVAVDGVSGPDAACAEGGGIRGAD